MQPRLDAENSYNRICVHSLTRFVLAIIDLSLLSKRRGEKARQRQIKRGILVDPLKFQFAVHDSVGVVPNPCVRFTYHLVVLYSRWDAQPASLLGACWEPGFPEIRILIYFLPLRCQETMLIYYR